MTWIIGAAVAILLTMVTVVFVIAVPRFRLIQKLVDKLNLVTRDADRPDGDQGVNTQDYEEKKFDEANRDVTRVNLFINR